MCEKSCTYWITTYWLGTLIQMLVVSAVFFLLWIHMDIFDHFVWRFYFYREDFGRRYVVHFPDLFHAVSCVWRD